MQLHEFFSPIALSLIAISFGGFVVLTMVMRLLQKVSSPLVEALRTTRNLLVPTGGLLYFLVLALQFPYESDLIKGLRTVLWIEVIWVLLSLLKVIFFTKASGDTWRSQVPGLLVDMMRLAMIVVGTALVIAGVWNKDLGGFLTTLGVGSLVIGLALQDTLGSLMAGIALLFERPFNEGDWIAVGDVIGRVNEMNWRSVRVVTRDNTMVVVPNSVLGKERISNFSRPSRIHGVILNVGFSYDDPPNKARRVLLNTLTATRDVLSRPEPSIRTKAYQDFSILYEIRFFISNYDRLPEIESDFMTRVWYAARRNGLTIPFPIRTVHKTEIQPKPQIEHEATVRSVLRSVPFFEMLGREEIDSLGRDAASQYFARGETIFSQGDAGDALYLIQHGSISVTVRDERGHEKEVAQLGKGEFFGEMSLLSGEPRSATVIVLEDCEVIVVYKEALAPLLEGRPELAQVLADLVIKRQQGLSEIKEILDRDAAGREGAAERKGAILRAIKDFFRI